MRAHTGWRPICRYAQGPRWWVECSWTNIGAGGGVMPGSWTEHSNIASPFINGAHCTSATWRCWWASHVMYKKPTVDLHSLLIWQWAVREYVVSSAFPTAICDYLVDFASFASLLQPNVSKVLRNKECILLDLGLLLSSSLVHKTLGKFAWPLDVNCGHWNNFPTPITPTWLGYYIPLAGFK